MISYGAVHPLPTRIEGADREDGKGISNWDEFVKIPGKTFKGTTGAVAVDFIIIIKKILHEWLKWD